MALRALESWLPRPSRSWTSRPSIPRRKKKGNEKKKEGAEGTRTVSLGDAGVDIPGAGNPPV